MIGCDVLEPDPPLRWRGRQVATPEQVQTCVDNLQGWYLDALDERTREVGRASGLSEWAVELLIPPRS